MPWHRLSAVKSTWDDSGMKLRTEVGLGSKKWSSGWGCYWQIERKIFLALSTSTESDPKVTIPRLFIGRRLKISLARPGGIVTRKGPNLTKVKSSFFSLCREVCNLSLFAANTSSDFSGSLHAIQKALSDKFRVEFPYFPHLGPFGMGKLTMRMYNQEVWLNF